MAEENIYLTEKTQDGSISFKNLEFNESYHSIIGAYTEALHKHVLACKIVELAKSYDKKTINLRNIDNNAESSNSSEPIKILDVCFGLGYNSGVAIEKIWEINPEQRIEIIALESDIGIIQRILELEIPENYQDVHKKLTSLSKLAPKMEQGSEILKYEEENLVITVFLDDARNSVKSLANNYFDAVFFDPFSPKSCPVLWTEEFIQDVVNTANTGAYISTYSSARIAKDGFANAGCELFEGPKLNRRNGGVLAKKI